MGLKSSHSFYQKQQDPVYYITASSIVFFKKTRSFSVDVGGDSTINKVKFVPHNLLQQGTSCTHHPYGGRMEQNGTEWNSINVSRLSPSGISTTNENTGNIYIPTYQPTYHTLQTHQLEVTTKKIINSHQDWGLGYICILLYFFYTNKIYEDLPPS